MAEVVHWRFQREAVIRKNDQNNWWVSYVFWALKENEMKTPLIKRNFNFIQIIWWNNMINCDSLPFIDNTIISDSQTEYYRVRCADRT